MQKKISIITVVYNGEKYIEDTIKSVTSQKNNQIEYIIVDGNSRDSTMSIINKYKEDIDIIISEDDRGIYDAMNKGWMSASGEYVAFLNSDDFYLPGMIDSVLTCLEESPDMVIANTLIQDDKGNRNIFKRIETSNNYKLHLRLPFMHPSVFLKRNTIAEVNGFNLNYKIAADCDLLLKVIKQSIKIRYVDSNVVMRLGGASDTNYKLGRKEYREIYCEKYNKKMKAWIGYYESILVYYILQLVRVFK
ncbi:glycosyltransferase family 2 protein [Citrobacter freundii]|uniref:glycosyltransferase family 2 protein n=1 Tax=Citrobacter freundii TaxID=546 RepID=UPI003F8EE4FB